LADFFAAAVFAASPPTLRRSANAGLGHLGTSRWPPDSLTVSDVGLLSSRR
jgi:hypothetical protein